MNEDRIRGMINAQVEAPLIQGGPIDGSTMESFNAQQAAPPPMAAQPMINLVKPMGTQDIAAFDKSSLPKMMQKNGIDNKGLALNDIGRIQLLGRLKKRFGDQYEKYPEALDILSAFDEEVGKAPMSSARSMSAAVSGGERTLRALLGGK